MTSLCQNSNSERVNRIPAIRKLRTALHNQRDPTVGVFGCRLTRSWQRYRTAAFELPLQAVRDVCLLHRKPNTSNAYWERWNQLHSQLLRQVPWRHESGRQDAQRNAQSQLDGGESQLSPAQLLFSTP